MKYNLNKQYSDKKDDAAMDQVLIIQKIASRVEVIETIHISAIKESLRKIEERLEQYYVIKSEFTPVRTIVYGMVGIILVAVIGALIALVLK